MAFTESQIIQAGGAVNNNKSVPAPQKKRTQAPPPLSPSANYKESVDAANANALSSQISSGTVASNGQLTEYQGLPVYRSGQSWNFGKYVSVQAQNGGYEISVYGRGEQWMLNKQMAFSSAQSLQNNLPAMGSFLTGQGTALFTPPTGLATTPQNSANLQKLNLFNQQIINEENLIGNNLNALNAKASMIKQEEALYDNPNSSQFANMGLFKTINSQIAQYNSALKILEREANASNITLANELGLHYLLGQSSNPFVEFNDILQGAGSKNSVAMNLSFQQLESPAQAWFASATQKASNTGIAINWQQAQNSAWTLLTSGVPSSTSTTQTKSLTSWALSDIDTLGNSAYAGAKDWFSFISNPQTYSTAFSDLSQIKNTAQNYAYAGAKDWFSFISNPQTYSTAFSELQSGAKSIYDFTTDKSVTNFFDVAFPNFIANTVQAAGSYAYAGAKDWFSLISNPKTYRTAFSDYNRFSQTTDSILSNPQTYSTAFSDLEKGGSMAVSDVKEFMNSPFNFAGFAAPHVSDIFALSVGDLAELNNITFNPNKFSSFVSKNRKEIEFGTLIGADIVAGALTFGSAEAVLEPVTDAVFVEMFGTTAFANLAAASGAGALSFAAGNTILTEGSSLIQTGKNASNQSLISSAETGFELGAIAGPLMDIGGGILKLGYGAATGKTAYTLMSLPEYFAKYGMTNDVLDIGETFSSLSDNGMDVSDFDFNKVFFSVDKNGGVGMRYYNDVHLGYGKGTDIFNYLTDISERNPGESLNFGSAAKGDFTTENTIKSLQELSGGKGLGGVRANAAPEYEGMYFNVPSYNNNPIFLNYLGLKGGGIGSGSIMRFSLNPFASEGTFYSGAVDIEDIQAKTISDFVSETGWKGDINSPAAQNAISRYAGESAQEEGAFLFSPYQNIVSQGGDEIQEMATVNSIWSGAGSKVMLLDYSNEEAIIPKLLPKVTFTRFGSGMPIGFTEGISDTKITDYGNSEEINSFGEPVSVSTRSINPVSVSALFYSGSSIVDPIISGNASNYRGFSTISPSNSNLDFSSSGLFNIPSVSGLSTSLGSSGFLKGSISSFPSSIRSNSSKSSLIKSVSSAGGSLLSNISSFSSQSSSIESASSSNNSPSSSKSPMGYDSDYWFRHGFPFGLIFGGEKKSQNAPVGSIWTQSHYVPSLGAEFFNITGGKKTVKRQNSKGGIRNSFIRPIIT